jgi:hypothetical protein
MAEAFTAMYGIERSCQAQLPAMACNTELNHMPAETVQKSIDRYDPTVIGRYGLLVARPAAQIRPPRPVLSGVSGGRVAVLGPLPNTSSPPPWGRRGSRSVARGGVLARGRLFFCVSAPLW